MFSFLVHMLSNLMSYVAKFVFICCFMFFHILTYFVHFFSYVVQFLDVTLCAHLAYRVAMSCVRFCTTYMPYFVQHINCDIYFLM